MVSQDWPVSRTSNSWEDEYVDPLTRLHKAVKANTKRHATLDTSSAESLSSLIERHWLGMRRANLWLKDQRLESLGEGEDFDETAARFVKMRSEIGRLGRVAILLEAVLHRRKGTEDTYPYRTAHRRLQQFLPPKHVLDKPRCLPCLRESRWSRFNPCERCVYSSRGSRASTDVSKFRHALIKSYESTKSESNESSNIRCPITRQYLDFDGWREIQVAPIFPFAIPGGVMDYLFGNEIKSRLYSVYNGLILDPCAEELFTMHHLVIVPDVKEQREEAYAKWSMTETCEWRMIIINKRHPRMKGRNYNSKKSIEDLDGERLHFTNGMRPHAAYLFWHYCIALIKRGKGPHELADRQAREDPYIAWAAKNQVLQPGAMAAMLEYVGHRLSKESKVLPEVIDRDREVGELLTYALINQELTVGLALGLGDRGGRDLETFEKDEEDEDYARDASDSEYSEIFQEWE